ncbi:MAG: ribbon-helix-helix protein, CopG family [Firmicutes bacterium]|nr:ribbon-helix-helix protein, CopG family [Bacillota bacterium]
MKITFCENYSGAGGDVLPEALEGGQDRDNILDTDIKVHNKQAETGSIINVGSERVVGLTKKVMVLFDPEQYERVREEARQKGITVGALIRQAVARELARRELPGRKGRLEAARRLVGAQEEVLEWDELERLLERGHLS